MGGKIVKGYPGAATDQLYRQIYSTIAYKNNDAAARTEEGAAMVFGTGNYLEGVYTQRVSQASRFPLFWDGYWKGSGGNCEYFFSQFSNGSMSPHARHAERIHSALLDGHAEAFQPGDMRQTLIDGAGMIFSGSRFRYFSDSFVNIQL